MKNNQQAITKSIYEPIIISIIIAIDPRTTNWLLIKEPWSTILLVSAYLLIVLIGPVLMKRREAMDLKQVMFIYNFCLVMLNAYITVEVS